VWKKLSGPLTRRMAALSDYRDTISPKQSPDVIVRWDYRPNPNHVTFDLDLYLDHILDAGPRVDRRVQVWWRSSHLPARISDFRAYSYDLSAGSVSKPLK